MVFTYTFIDFSGQEYVTVIYHIDILGWTSDNKRACWHIVSLVSRRSGAHQTFWNNSSVTVILLALKQYFYACCYLILLRCRRCFALCQKYNIPEQQSYMPGGYGWRWKSVICTYHNHPPEWFIGMQVAQWNVTLVFSIHARQGFVVTY